jgi:sugar phosphate isomerase/epimerase
VSLGPDDLVLCTATVQQGSFVERCEAAAAAGFTGLSIYLDDLKRARSEGCSDADIVAVLRQQGLAIAELDPLMSWVPGADLGGDVRAEGEGFFGYGEADFYATAELVGARSINAVLYAEKPVPPDALAEAFAALCDRARERGLLVHLEFLPWTQVADLASALAVVEAAGRENGGVMFDAWHHFRGGGGSAELEAAAPRVLAIQLDDAPAAAEDDLVTETLQRRLLPGEGDIGLVELVRRLDAGGCRAPIGVEVFSTELQKLPAREAAQRAADTTRAVLSEARR